MTKPKTQILLTGATGYIGRRLKERLLQREDLQLRLLVRDPEKLRTQALEQAQMVIGDTFDLDALTRALDGVDVAYYLIHSMDTGADYAEQDRRSADNFRRACRAAGVRRIIYLGGLGRHESASEHLRSRLETGEILSADKNLQTLWFRAGVIIGAGSASFEIIYHLLQNLPLMITPRWLTTRTQAIAVGDVIRYLEAALDAEIEGSRQIDIGAAACDFEGLMRQAAQTMGLKRRLIQVPVLTPRLSSYWLILTTPVPFSIASALVEGLKSETLVENDHAREFFPDIRPMDLEQAFRAALREQEEDQVLSRWCDSSLGGVCDLKAQDAFNRADRIMKRDERRFPLDGRDPQRVFTRLCAIGGHEGWYAFNPLWRWRGRLDKLIGGAGLNRGRRSPGRLRIGDAVDFWKVADLKPDQRLLLLAQMKLPGSGWLEFVLEGDELVQTAHFRPRGLGGRVYWWLMVPFHALIFGRLGKRLLEKVDK